MSEENQRNSTEDGGGVWRFQEGGQYSNKKKCGEGQERREKGKTQRCWELRNRWP